MHAVLPLPPVPPTPHSMTDELTPRPLTGTGDSRAWGGTAPRVLLLVPRSQASEPTALMRTKKIPSGKSELEYGRFFSSLRLPGRLPEGAGSAPSRTCEPMPLPRPRLQLPGATPARIVLAKACHVTVSGFEGGAGLPVTSADPTRNGLALTKKKLVHAETQKGKR